MKSDRPSGMLLARASLCLELDCDTVFDSSESARCPGCGSGESYRLANWLNRDGIVQELARVHRPGSRSRALPETRSPRAPLHDTVILTR
jgi:hypothetical protein